MSDASDDLLREYIELVKERLYWKFPKSYGSGEKERKFGFFSTDGKSDKIARDWIDEKEEHYDEDLPSDIRASVAEFCRKNYDAARKRARGDLGRVKKLLKKALDEKFKQRLDAWELSWIGEEK